MKNLTLIFILISSIVPYSCQTKQDNSNGFNVNIGTQEDSSVVLQTFEDSLVYQFINEIGLIRKNTIVEQVISERTMEAVNFGTKDSISSNFSIYLEPSSFLFSPKDSNYVLSQVGNVQNKIWNLKNLNAAETQNKYNSWCMKNYPFDWDQFRNDGFGCFLTLGVPIFNRKHDTAFIYVGYTCHSTIGSGSIRKYKKVNGKWKLDEEANLWIS